MASSPTKKLAIILYLGIIHLLAFAFILEKITGRKEAAGNTVTIAPVRDTPVVQQPLSYSDAAADTGKLLIPVAGIKRKDLQDTYTQSRSGGRAHNAIDITAPGGTPVLAAADGIIAKFFESKLGGITIYQWGVDSSRIYYYAHLQRRADGISEGMAVKRGTVLGYVGDTGDAGPGNFHLHFGISTPTAPGRYWSGTDINPYSLLKEGIEPQGR